MSPAVADLKGALNLSIWFETTKRLLNDVIRDKDHSALARVNIRMNSDHVDDLPVEQQRELTFLFGKAISATRGWGAP